MTILDKLTATREAIARANAREKRLKAEIASLKKKKSQLKVLHSHKKYLNTLHKCRFITTQQFGKILRSGKTTILKALQTLSKHDLIRIIKPTDAKKGLRLHLTRKGAEEMEWNYVEPTPATIHTYISIVEYYLANGELLRDPTLFIEEYNHKLSDYGQMEANELLRFSNLFIDRHFECDEESVSFNLYIVDRHKSWHYYVQRTQEIDKRIHHKTKYTLTILVDDQQTGERLCHSILEEMNSPRMDILFEDPFKGTQSISYAVVDTSRYF